MPKPYSLDLRNRVLAALDQGATLEAAAERFDVGRATVYRWSRRRRLTGSAFPEPMGGPRAVKLDDAGLQELRRLIEARPDLTIAELADMLAASGISVSTSTISRGLAKLDITRKKKSVIAQERNSERVALLRERFMERQGSFDPARLVFVDEAGSHVSMTRQYARARRGVRAEDHVPRNRGAVVTMIGALTIGGVEAIMTVEGATSAEVFLSFIEGVLAEKLLPGDIVVLDNLGAHRAAAVREAVSATGAELVFLPPYSPDLNPIEECWSKMKEALRSAKARTREALDRAIAAACDSVTFEDAAAGSATPATVFNLRVHRCQFRWTQGSEQVAEAAARQRRAAFHHLARLWAGRAACAAER